MKNWENTIWVELSSINDGKRIYVLFDDEWCWKMTETEARNSYSIITFLEVFWALNLSNYGLELVFYGGFMLLEVFGSLFD
jgi:hypothetical protein